MTNDMEYKQACQILDKLTLQCLHLIEEKLRHTIAVETSLHEGALHLAKARYIMGQQAVSAHRLPTAESEAFAASVRCEREEVDGVEVFKMQEKSETTVNPIKWFGVLVPRNLHKAQRVFRSTLDHVVELANTHVRLANTMRHIALLSHTKNNLRQ